MAVGRGVVRGSRAAKGMTYRMVAPTLLLLVFVTTAVLLYGDSFASVGLERTYIASGHVHAYMARTFLALRPTSDPLRAKADNLFKQVKDQIAIVNAYASFARKAKLDMVKEVRVFSDQGRNYTELLERPENRAMLESGSIDEENLRSFEREIRERMRITRQAILDAKELFDNQLKIQKLKDTIFAVNDQLSKAKKQGAFSSLIAAKSIPKSLHCLSMRLMEECIAHSETCAQDKPAPELEDPKLYHYAIFSDNVIATSVVVNSLIKNCKDPKKHVLHIVTDKMNLAAMRTWFKLRPPGKAHIDVKAVEDYKFLNSSYVPVLRQLESANLQRFYFENKMENATKDSSNMKFRNPKYLSMLNHLRFYLPEMYPNLHRILFLDDDIVVQKDLTGLWEIDMNGKVNGAVETCFGSFHRYDKYMNFSHPLIKARINPKACGWAYGMNFFDLDAWRREKSTEEYHYWQNLNENRTLWKLGTLPPGLITFYKTTKPLNKSWHVLGLGYNPNISIDKIKSAAVIHFNGNLKPWLDLAMNQYRDYWTKYVDYEMEFVQLCNFGL
ncbi:unnamed protein product [Sphagnum troendelagicum]|uniref:Hexosyltransferase n=1 Tax=Sphagnum troendelagicum TaxID=128251 RepID=A0ABP0TLS2_9BRYO